MHQNGKTVAVDKGYRESSEAQKRIAKLKNRKAAGEDQRANEFMIYGGDGMLSMMVMLYNGK